MLKVKKLTEFGYIPSRSTDSSVGFDLYSAYDYIIKPGEQRLCKTDIAICLPEGCYGRIASRSGISSKNNVHVGAGVIDPDYRGNVGILLFNLGKEPFVITNGDRIAQLICEKVLIPSVEEVNELELTSRNDKGFGSSGLNK